MRTRLFLLILLATCGSAEALASFSFTATFYETSCPTTVVVPKLPSVGPFPNSSQCESTKALVDADKQSFTWPCPLGCTRNCSSCTCQVGFNTTACTGTDDPIGGALAALPNQVNAVNTITTDVGQPSFSLHYDQAQTQWQTEASLHVSPFYPLNNGARTSRSIDYQNRFFSRIQGGSSRLMTLGTQVSAAEPPRSTFTGDDGELLPMIGNDANPVPITGAGASFGKPDKAPPPNPQYNEGVGRCHARGWWYNSVTRMCYATQASCLAAGVEDRSHLVCTPSP